MQGACAVLYCRLWPVRLYHTFPHYPIKGKNKKFWPQKWNICTAIFHCIYRQILTNSSNKIFTDFPYIIHCNSNFMKLLLNGTLGSIYSLRANNLFFIFILMADDFLSLSESRNKFKNTTSISYSLHIQLNVLVSLHFQHMAILNIQLILTSSEPTHQYLPVSFIFLYTHEGLYFIKINKIML